MSLNKLLANTLKYGSSLGVVILNIYVFDLINKSFAGPTRKLQTRSYNPDLKCIEKQHDPKMFFNECCDDPSKIARAGD